MKRRRRVSSVLRNWTSHVQMDLLHDPEHPPGLTQLSATGDHERLRWYEVGPTDAALTVVFIHGYGLSAESFYDQVEYLREHYPHVRSLLMDLRGHGQSQQVPASDCTIDDAGDDVLSIIAERAPSGQLIIVGHSLGGMVAQNVIRRAPSLVYQRIESALLISTSMRPFAETGAAALLQSSLAEGLYNAAQHLPARVNRARRGFARVAAPIFAALVTGFPQMERLQFHVEMLLDTPLDSFVGFFDDLIDHAEYGAAARLADVPGIVMVGGLDIVTPKSQSEMLCKQWPGAELIVVPGAGHMVILEEPADVAAALSQLVDAAQ
ncbi:alpha/beta fold hydrolase [Corynebacterium lizhenjunii]|uniref:alpha/beta fold hydrolase n=1 Tax=Corynebacterium lizhenjunii TaxID=2709394 RepID=UPI0013ED7046|nr:alpha/beta hydrolase [Corynebacterium lizhenjunii]